MTGRRHLRAKSLRAHIWPREQAGHYVEPEWCSIRLFEEEWFGPAGSLVFDPAAGWCRIPKAAAAAGYTALGADIVDRRLNRQMLDGSIAFATGDFLERPPIPAVHSIVCNPPFNHIQAFCERALEIATHKVAMLVPLRRLPAARWLGGLPLETVWVMTPRPSMPPGSYIAAGNKPGGGSQDFCWLVFRKGLSPGRRGCGGFTATPSPTPTIPSFPRSPTCRAKRPPPCTATAVIPMVAHRKDPTMLDRTAYTTPPETTPVRVLSGNSISKTTSWTARQRAALAARWTLGLIEVKPTIKAAAETFHVSVPYVMEAIADLKADGEHLTKRNGNGVQLSLDDIWTHMDADEQAMFAHRNLSTVWAAVENVT
jgi:hypothetical protein